MSYKPGTHIIASLSTTRHDRLQQFEALRHAVDCWIADYQLNRLGEVYHNFTPAGFTAVVCLSESHISVHTWPESGRVNLDIYLSNYQRDNDGTVRSLYENFVDWFEGVILQEQTIYR
jgi:S-adenosylmethionine decarboxylase